MSRLKDKKRLLFVLNPKAGGKSKAYVPDAISTFCLENNFLFDVLITTGKEDYEKLEEQLLRIKYDGVIAIGGDGTVSLVGRLLIGTNIPLGILPLGSANGLARDLGIPKDFFEALEVIGKFKSKYIDTLILNGYHCFHLSDLGFNARIIHRFAKSLLRGKLLYVWYGMLEFFTFRCFKYTLDTSINHYEGEAFMMIVTNANKFGTNVAINPLGDIRDGYFEINILKPFPKYHSFHIMYYLLKDQIHKSKYYQIIRCKKAVIFNTDNEYFHIDGEPMPLVSKLEVEINPKSLKIIQP